MRTGVLSFRNDGAGGRKPVVAAPAAAALADSVLPPITPDAAPGLVAPVQLLLLSIPRSTGVSFGGDSARGRSGGASRGAVMTAGVDIVSV